jgi:hypothetical protein
LAGELLKDRLLAGFRRSISTRLGTLEHPLDIDVR